MAEDTDWSRGNGFLPCSSCCTVGVSLSRPPSPTPPTSWLLCSSDLPQERGPASHAACGGQRGWGVLARSRGVLEGLSASMCHPVGCRLKNWLLEEGWLMTRGQQPAMGSAAPAFGSVFWKICFSVLCQSACPPMRAETVIHLNTCIYPNARPQRGLHWRLQGKESACNAGDTGLIPEWEDPLQEKIAMHSSSLAWEIPRTEEPSGLQSTGSQESDVT